MRNFDAYADSLIENSKYLLSKANESKNENAKIAFYQSSILLSFCALEAYVYSICNELFEQGKISIFEKSFLIEKEIKLENGEFIITKTTKMTRVTDRIEYLYRYFKKKSIDKTQPWWDNLIKGQKLRNSIVHPKDEDILDSKDIENTILSIIECINILFKTIYKKEYPLNKRRLDYKIDYQ